MTTKRVSPPVFYPTLAEMNSMSLEQYVESIEEQLEEYGIGRIVPPAGWTPRAGGYEDVDFRVEKAITQHATGRKGLFRTLLVEKKPLSVKHDFKPMAELPQNQPPNAVWDDQTHAALEREFWKKVAYDPPTYCADVAGSLFDKQDASQEIKSNEMSPNSKSKSKIPTSGWDVSRLDSLLSRTLREKNITLSGVNSSYLYFGMWRSLFAWHTEDCDLYSVNYLHYGAPKFWYAVAPEDRARFEILAQGMVPEMWRHCPEFLRHKELLISPTLLEQNGIPFTRMMQYPGEFVVTFPGSYHSGFNCGYNCAESCNFATKAWVEIGEDAGHCQCVPDAVTLDMRIFGDLCTRCHDTASESESGSESGNESEDDESDDEIALARYKKGGAPGKALAVGGGAAGKTTKKTSSVVDLTTESDGEEVSLSGTKRKGVGGKKEPAKKAAKREPKFLAPNSVGVSARVAVPTGWQRNVVMRAGAGAPPPAGPGRPKSVTHDRDTYYTGPDGVVVKSKYEVVKYLGTNPSTGVSARDFFFESLPSDLPPARLVMPPGTPSPTGSADGNRGKNRQGSKTAGTAKKERAAQSRAASDTQTREKKPSADRRGSGGRDALGLLNNGVSSSVTKRTGVMKKAAPAKPADAKTKVLKAGAPLVTSAQRSAGIAIGSETFSSWTKGGVLETAVAKVMSRAGSVGKYAYGIRGSSLVAQVEQALGVGSGALKEHGTQIQSLAAKRRGRVV